MSDAETLKTGASVARPSFGLAVVRVAVEDRGHRVARERLLQPAAAEERINLERLALDRRLDRGVVQDGDEPFGAQPRQRGLELQRLVQALVDELLDDRLRPTGRAHAARSRRRNP